MYVIIAILYTVVMVGLGFYLAHSHHVEQAMLARCKVQDAEVIAINSTSFGTGYIVRTESEDEVEITRDSPIEELKLGDSTQVISLDNMYMFLSDLTEEEKHFLK